MVAIHNIILGIALFEIFHDIQYLAIVWVYNKKRVEKSSNIGGFMRFLFRRSFAMLGLYVGLIVAYGIASSTGTYQSESLQRSIMGIGWASALLHFYFDGFIWKVREKSTSEVLGLNGENNATEARLRWSTGEIGHLLKWTPFLILVGYMSVSEFDNSAAPDSRSKARRWPRETVLERERNLVEAVPTNPDSRTRLAVSLDERGQTEAALKHLQIVFEFHPEFADAWLIAGSIAQRFQDWDAAIMRLKGAVLRYQQMGTARSKPMLHADAHFRLGQVYLRTGDPEQARDQFQRALQLSPNHPLAKTAIEELVK